MFSISSERTFDSVISYELSKCSENSICKSTISLIPSNATSKASNIVFSGTKLDPPSIIQILSFLPVTIRSKSEDCICSAVGLRTYSPSISPIFTEAIGPSNGTGDNNKAAEAPIAAITSGVFSWS